MKKEIFYRIGMYTMLALVCLVVHHAQAEDFPEITAEQLKTKIDSGVPIMLINPLSEVDFAQKHIPGSVNIPAQDMMYTTKLPRDKDQLIVTYCLGRE